MQNILVTGSEGYIGTLLVERLLNKGYRVIGVDACFYSSGNLTHENLPFYTLLRKDIRDLVPEDLKGIDAVIHLAALSNDPLGKLNEDLTYDINYRASVNLAEMARQAGVQRFIYSSSCSLYGDGQGQKLTETSASNPQTAYGKSKVLSEQEISKLATDSFSPVYMRNATAFGISQRMRFDIVVNSLSGFATTTNEIRILGDGKPWRPLVHIADISDSMIKTLEVDREIIHDQAFNVGDDQENFQIKTIAERIQAHYPACEVSIAQKDAGDARNYQVSFEKLNNTLGYKVHTDLEAGVREITETYKTINLSTQAFESPLYNRLKQINFLMENNIVDQNLKWNNTTLATV